MGSMMVDRVTFGGVRVVDARGGAFVGFDTVHS
jgi:hypothetical protein